MPDLVAGRRRFLAAALLGSLLALGAVVWMLLAGHLDPLRNRGPFAAFLDAQGHALLHGHLDVDPSVVSFEGFRIAGRTYIYFGPVPALLRLPVLAFTHELDGRLAEPSMLLAAVVLLSFAARLHWRVRSLVRSGAPVERADLVAAFLLALSLGAGSVVLYLASSSLVYYETELWGAALSVAAVDAVVAVLCRPSGRRIAWAGLLAALAVNTRFSIGLGPILALVLVGLGAAAQLRSVRALAWLGPLRQASGRTVALLAAAALLALLSSVAVNEAKFRQPFGFPIEKQVDAQIDANRKAVLAANGGSLFGAKFVPSQVVQAVRPDAVGTVRAFPFIGLPHALPAKIGDVRFDSREQSLSALTSMPLLCLLTLAGIVAAARRARLRPLLGVLGAALASFAPVLTIADITTRYLADLLPFLLLGALVGLQALLAATVRRRGVLLGVIAALTAAGIVVNAGAALEFQRLLDPGTSDADRAAFVRTQDDVDRALGRRPHGIQAGAQLPRRAPRRPGDLFVVGRCDGLYVAGQHDGWLAAERTPRTGLHRLAARFGRPLPGRPATLLALGTGPQRVLVTAHGAGDRLVVAVVSGGRTVAASSPLPVPSGATPVIVSIDKVSWRYYAAVRVAGRHAVTAEVPDVRADAAAVGPGVAAEPSSAPVCRQVARRAGIL